MGVKKKENPIEDEEAELDPKDVVSLEDYKERTLPFFDRLFSSCDSRTARNCSRKERDENNYTDSSLTYGEILFEPFAEVLLKLKCLYGFRDVGGKFVDIGSGSGKAVFGAALLHKFDDCVGIEILEGLHGLAEQQLAKWNDMISEEEELQRKKYVKITLTHGDATVISWSDADIVFMNCTCFDDNILAKLAHQASDLKPGSFVLTTTRALPSPNFEILDSFAFLECWGNATIFVQRRKNLS